MLVNKVMSMNRYDEVTGQPLQTASPKKDFGVPLPGDPSLAFTLEKNKLADIYGRLSNSVQMLGEHPEAREIIESRGLNERFTTGRFQPPSRDEIDSQRRAMMSMGDGDPININSQGMVNHEFGAGIINGAPLGATLSTQQPDAIHTSQGAATTMNRANRATDQLTNQMASLGQSPQDGFNVFSTQNNLNID